jgi:homoisocitrate dehydrogenase
MSHTICAIPGDGIGREVIPAAVAVLQAAVPGLRVEWADAGFETLERTGEALPARTLRLVEGTAATLFGAVSSPLQPTPGYESAILALRRRLDLYACVRPVRGFAPASRADLIVVRENTECLYGGGEESDGQRAVARRVITRAASQRVARLAFGLARRLGRHRVTMVHKATVLPQTCGLFREAVLEVAQDFPEIAVDEMLVDSAALRLATQPARFDVILTTNLFGDILSDLATMHAGGLGLAPSANLGDHAAVFEPVHGSAPDIAGQGIANPLAAILAGAMLLDHIGEHAAAAAVRAAVAATVTGPTRTPDLGGSATTAEVTQAVSRQLSGDRTHAPSSPVA